MERGVTTRAANAARVWSLALSPGAAQARQHGLSKTKPKVPAAVQAVTAAAERDQTKKPQREKPHALEKM